MKEKLETLFGKWKLIDDENEYDGKLKVDKTSGMFELEIIIMSKEHLSDSKKFSERIKFITGDLENGKKKTLLNCQHFGPAYQVSNHYDGSSRYTYKYSFHPQFIIDNLCLIDKNDVLFNEMRFELSNAFIWGGLTNYNPDFKNDCFSISNEISNITIFKNSNIEVYYDLGMSGFSMDSLKEIVEFRHIPYIKIKSKNKKNISWFLDRLRPFIRLIEFATNRKVSILDIETLEISIENGKPYPKFYNIEANYIEKEIPENREKLIKFELLFDLNDLIEYADIDAWISNYELIQPVLSLYLIVKQQNIYLEGYFLNIIQALEIYHCRFVVSDSISVYRKRVEKLSEEYSKKDGYEAYLLQDNNNRISLRMRIADLILNAKMIFDNPLDIENNELPRMIAITRNYYTHYNIKKENEALKDEDLLKVSRFLSKLLTYYLLIGIGFDAGFAKKIVNEKIRRY